MGVLICFAVLGNTSDSIVFDALNLTKDERDAVYEAVINLVEARLKKAGSV